MSVRHLYPGRGRLLRTHCPETLSAGGESASGTRSAGGESVFGVRSALVSGARSAPVSGARSAPVSGARSAPVSGARSATVSRARSAPVSGARSAVSARESGVRPGHRSAAECAVEARWPGLRLVGRGGHSPSSRSDQDVGVPHWGLGLGSVGVTGLPLLGLVPPLSLLFHRAARVPRGVRLPTVGALRSLAAPLGRVGLSAAPADGCAAAARARHVRPYVPAVVALLRRRDPRLHGYPEVTAPHCLWQDAALER